MNQEEWIEYLRVEYKNNVLKMKIDMEIKSKK